MARSIAAAEHVKSGLLATTGGMGPNIRFKTMIRREHIVRNDKETYALATDITFSRDASDSTVQTLIARSVGKYSKGTAAMCVPSLAHPRNGGLRLFDVPVDTPHQNRHRIKTQGTQDTKTFSLQRSCEGRSS